MPEIPRRGTREYEWWTAGALAEAKAQLEGRSTAGLSVLSLVDAFAENRPTLNEAQIAAGVFRIFAGGRSRSLWCRLRLAWWLLSDSSKAPPQ
jgi:hypothetical protein